ncbi:hypothetical protein [Flavobacterium oreochromis]|uniref:Uncharacterized protein n=2 Tax=Flavobacterium TaxID=237 RepID=A0A246GEE3_9FLAO|nr:hypothetical protein [Flavobacterium oreochromis]OWP79044.1 hypothetical protein BWG23_00445 [Flavobacterium oreochromis]OWP79750.1 hypothetical protein BWK62_00505 [Flavobacterium oreochromis]POR30820.1 hypothetical protein BWK58_00555 [Flavobacterium columnare]
MLGIFNSKKEDWLIPNPKNFSARYKMLTQNTFLMGVENKPLEMKTETILQINQRITNDFIETAVTVESIKGDSPNEELQDHLTKTLALSDISKTLLFQRNPSGKFLSIKNKVKLKNDWEKWKNTEIHKLFKEEKEKEKFILNYEKGFEKIDQTIPFSFQNAVLIPALYSFKSYQNNKNSFSPLSLNSKLIADLIITYEMSTTRTEINNIGEAKINLKSRLLNTAEMKRILENLYSNSNNFSTKNYQFGIYLDYVLERETGKILKSMFSLTEIIQEHLRYDLTIELNEI